jgi:hypothetical protein
MSRAEESAEVVEPVVDTIEREFPQVIEWLTPLLSARDFAFVAGSRVAGLGNAGSDFDVIPVFEDAVPDVLRRREGARLPRLIISASNQLLNVEDALTLDDVEAIREEIEALDIKDAGRLLAPPLPLRLDTYLRFCIGVPALNPAAFRVVAARFDTAVYRRVAAAWLTVSCQRALTESRFWTQRKQEDAARLALEQALSYAVGFHLLSCGEIYRPWARWRYEELQRSEGEASDFAKAAWDLKAMGRRELPEYATAVTAFCLAALADAEKFNGHLLCNVQAAKDVTAVHLDDDLYLVKNESYVYRLAHPAAAEFWARVEAGYDASPLPLAGSGDAERDVKTSDGVELGLIADLERAGLVDLRLAYRETATASATPEPVSSSQGMLERLEMSPGQLVLSRLYGHLIRGGFFSRPWASVMAAVRVEQWGIAVVRARDALRGAVDAALAVSGVAYAVDLGHRRRELLQRMAPDGPELAARYVELELENPSTADEVAAYVARCGEFARRLLAGFPINERENDLSLDERHTLLLESIENAATLAASMGVKTPVSVDAVSSTIAFREAVATAGSVQRVV